MTWRLGHADDSTSYTFSADKRGLDHSPIDVTVDGYSVDRPHVTVTFADTCIVSAIDETDETGDGQCVFTITSPHAELMVILPIRLATLLTSIEAAHREMLEQPAVAPVPGRSNDDIIPDVLQQLQDSITKAQRERRLKVVRTDAD